MNPRNATPARLPSPPPPPANASTTAQGGIAGARSFARWQAIYPQLIWAYAGRVDAPTQHLLEVFTRRMTAWLVTRGHVQLVSDDTILTVKRGQWVFFCGRFQKHDFSPAAELVSISLRIPAESETEWRHAPFVVKAAEHPQLEKTARALIALVTRNSPASNRSALQRPMPFAEALRINARAFEWAAACMDARMAAGVPMGEPRRGHPKVTRALTVLMGTPLHEACSETRLAAEVGLSAGHLEQLFVREMGTTPRRLRERHRRDEAARRVRHDDTSLKQLAWELGFGSPSHFSNWFRRVFGMSPRAWRRMEG
ncbi:AraC family transcriptional regulator [Geminisphaera colitermitum]|uniref:AraC family transcriptional regulator n=1 Tax=Geminisphaera colitermitum TaxID=1148786 RepID=UPI000694F1F4|nr:AraC family transcriptional regulator [Geminisphaera colitermitum]